jgi:hypothetical protein
VKLPEPSGATTLELGQAALLSAAAGPAEVQPEGKAILVDMYVP